MILSKWSKQGSKKFLVKSRDKKYSDVEEIKTHIDCSIEIFIQWTVLEKKKFTDYCEFRKIRTIINLTRDISKKKSKWFENLNI